MSDNHRCQLGSDLYESYLNEVHRADAIGIGLTWNKYSNHRQTCLMCIQDGGKTTPFQVVELEKDEAK